jgi:hypothetical protein
MFALGVSVRRAAARADDSVLAIVQAGQLLSFCADDGAAALQGIVVGALCLPHTDISDAFAWLLVAVPERSTTPLAPAPCDAVADALWALHCVAAAQCTAVGDRQNEQTVLAVAAELEEQQRLAMAASAMDVMPVLFHLDVFKVPALLAVFLSYAACWRGLCCAGDFACAAAAFL